MIIEDNNENGGDDDDVLTNLVEVEQIFIVSQYDIVKCNQIFTISY